MLRALTEGTRRGRRAATNTERAEKARALKPDFHQWAARDGGVRALEEAPPTSVRFGAVPRAVSRDRAGGPLSPSGAPGAPEPGLLQPALEPAYGAASAGGAPSHLQEQPGSPADPWKSMSTTVDSDMLSPGRTALCWTEQGAVTAPQWH